MTKKFWEDWKKRANETKMVYIDNYELFDINQDKIVGIHFNHGNVLITIRKCKETFDFKKNAH